MNRRTRRNLLSGLVLGAYCLIATGTSVGHRGSYGEFPLALHVSGNAAFLIERSEDAPYDDSRSRLLFSLLTVDNAPVLLQETSLEYTRGNWEFASISTTTADGPYTFAMAVTTIGGSFAAVVPEAGAPQTTAVSIDDRKLLSANRSELAETPRDHDRRWIYLQQAVMSDEDSFLPLFEIRESKPALIADNVIWAGCSEERCQQVRVEDGRLRVYANVVTAEDSFSEVAESELIGGSGHYACTDTDGTPAVVFGITVYSLSMTAPALNARNISQVTGPCAARPAIEPPEVSALNRQSFSGTFASGERITVESRADGGKDQSSCDDDDCSPVKMRIWVTIDDPNGMQLRSHPLHEL